MNSEQLCTLIVDALDDVKAQDIIKLDVRRHDVRDRLHDRRKRHVEPAR